MSTSQREPTDATRPLPTRARTKPLPAPRAARRRATVRRVHPWSVLKLSLVFYFCVLLVVMLGLTILWSVIIRLEIIDALRELLATVGFDLIRIDGGNLARVVFLFGLVNVVLWSGMNVFLAFLYNLIADLVGGLRVTLAEDDAR